jgi:hypothetical protein
MLRVVLRFVHSFLEHMLGMHGFVHRLFELLMTVALVDHVVRLGALLMFVSFLRMLVVPILAGPRWVLSHAKTLAVFVASTLMLHHFFMQLRNLCW